MAKSSAIFNHLVRLVRADRLENGRRLVRRLTRLTSAFSKKIAALQPMVALHFMCYNAAYRQQTPQIMPAMEAEISDRVCS
jgi:hypothetical protein